MAYNTHQHQDAGGFLNRHLVKLTRLNPIHQAIERLGTFSRRPDANWQMLLTHNTQFSIFLSQELIGINLPHLFKIKLIFSAASE